MIISPRPENTELMSTGGYSHVMGRGILLVLVGNPSRDCVSAKILVRRHLKPNPQLL